MYSSEPFSNKTVSQQLDGEEQLAKQVLCIEPSSSYLLQNTYYITQKLGNGQFGKVSNIIIIFEGKLYKAINVHTMENVAVKIHSLDQAAMLKHEYTILNQLSNLDNFFPKPLAMSATNEFSYLVMQFLGPNLQVVLSRMQSNKFSLQNVAVIAIQALDRLRVMHLSGIVHRDLKPENFLLGSTERTTQGTLFLVDFGLANKFEEVKSDNNNHKQSLSIIGWQIYQIMNQKYLTGTARYSSINALKGEDVMPKDELESLGYVLVYLFNGQLP